ncbi:hypothetical protein NUW58_g7956 [Xylaria curta]|uniref:Uncharacterized protein n=1 Tax=Xylaria curta TaxID=42375 RepID=A0ACC1NEV2_9PEZI|nr:hypothetical protein NUW58_g7956 [Xylaria curta]
MAPGHFMHPVRYPPLVFAAGYIFSVLYLTYAVVNSLYASYKSPGPVSNTRSRIHQRRKFIPVFSALAIAAFSIAAYWSVKSATLSYRTWSHQHGLDLDSWLRDENGKPITDTNTSIQQHIQLIANWLSDTPVYSDSLEIVAERARRFWWGQQIDLGTTAFSLILATEGRRRKIPLLTAFLALAHLVNLSFAQNLFFLALLLTPSPLPSGNEDLKLPVPPLPRSVWVRLRSGLMLPKPSGWVPDARFFYTAIILNSTLTLALPICAWSSAFTKAALLARASTFLPVLLPNIIPVNWGSVQRRPHGTYKSSTKLFKFLSTISLVLHVTISIIALLSDGPDSHRHRHIDILSWNVEKRLRWERSTTAVGKVLGSTLDHPAVAAVGWDVLLCALGLGVWAAVRSINARDIMSLSIPYYDSECPPLSGRARRKEIWRDEVLNFLESDEAEVRAAAQRAGSRGAMVAGSTIGSS